MLLKQVDIKSNVHNHEKLSAIFISDKVLQLLRLEYPQPNEGIV